MQSVCGRASELEPSFPTCSRATFGADDFFGFFFFFFLCEVIGASFVK